jgi:aminoglycoside 2'-N-acetyltransferase I
MLENEQNPELFFETLTGESSFFLHNQLKNLLNKAFEGDFDEGDWLNSCGGIRVLGWLNNEIVAHASIVPRQMLVNDLRLTVGYVEAVAVMTSLQNQGIGSLLLEKFTNECLKNFEFSVLSTDGFAFYGRAGWKRFFGESAVQLENAVVSTPDEDENLMYLQRSNISSATITQLVCFPRAGSPW